VNSEAYSPRQLPEGVFQRCSLKRYEGPDTVERRMIARRLWGERPAVVVKLITQNIEHGYLGIHS
jgi:hypothetical protein